MIEIRKDSKSATYILTKTDGEGFHHQMNLTQQELDSLAEILRVNPERQFMR